MRSAVIIACLVILAGLGGGVAWGWIEGRGAASAAIAAKPDKTGPSAALRRAGALTREVKSLAEDEAFQEVAHEVSGAMSNAGMSPMEFRREMKVPYNVASQMMIGKAMSVNQTLDRSWDGDAILRLNVSGLTNQKTTSIITENGKNVMTTTVWIDSAKGGEASVLRMKVVHDPVAMARLLSKSHPTDGGADGAPKISTFAIKTAMSFLASRSTKEMEEAYAHVLKTPDKEDDLKAAAYNNYPGFASLALHAMADGIFPETKGRRPPAPGW